MAIKIADLSSLRHFAEDGPKSLPVFDDNRTGHILCLEPGQEWADRSRHERLVYIVLEGQGQLAAGPREQPIGQTAMAMVEPQTDHTIRNNHDDRLALLRIQTRP